jgi:hypothetical protein
MVSYRQIIHLVSMSKGPNILLKDSTLYMIILTQDVHYPIIHHAVFSIAHPKYSNFGSILDAKW